MTPFEAAKRAAAQVALLPDPERTAALEAVADAICAQRAALLAANAEDLARMEKLNQLLNSRCLIGNKIGSLYYFSINNVLFKTIIIRNYFTNHDGGVCTVTRNVNSNLIVCVWITWIFLCFSLTF